MLTTEWSLCNQVFEDIQNLWGKFDVDLFASRLNFKIPSYVSWRPDPNAMFVNALYMNWHNYSFYAFPPFSLIWNMPSEDSTGPGNRRSNSPPLVSPTLVSSSPLSTYGQPSDSTMFQTLLTQSHNGALHPLRNQLQLIACKLSGERSNREAFQAKLSISSSDLELVEPRNNINHISRSGFNFVMEGRTIHMIHL